MAVAKQAPPNRTIGINVRVAMHRLIPFVVLIFFSCTKQVHTLQNVDTWALQKERFVPRIGHLENSADRLSQGSTGPKLSPCIQSLSTREPNQVQILKAGNYTKVAVTVVLSLSR